jgi:hypothetical protein
MFVNLSLQTQIKIMKEKIIDDLEHLLQKKRQENEALRKILEKLDENNNKSKPKKEK